MTPAEPHPSEPLAGGIAVVSVVDDDREGLESFQRALSDLRHPPALLVAVALGDDRLVDWVPDEDVLALKVVRLSARPDQRPWVEAANAGATVALDAGADVLVFTEIDQDVDELADALDLDDPDRAAHARAEGLWWPDAGPVTFVGVTRDAWARLGGLPEEDVDTVFDADYLTRAVQAAGSTR